ncbi:transcriptional protein SWT1 isoform X2 [Aricia agestis]|uniref:transcriptional protein SWT1 isoform X2 n=1 Tax=Aricia agestis TaxID=91739 RepID=UPI001C20BAB3|nr:transcriptional protein SWT1 isoform X2 [Aricia agestis]
MSSGKNESQKLPDGWVLCQSKSIPGRRYYFNKKTGKSSWSEPQADEHSDNKANKKEKMRKAAKRKKEEIAKKAMKRKSNEDDQSTSKKVKQESPNKKDRYKQKGAYESKKKETTTKTTPNTSFKASPTKKESPTKKTPVKNLANSRLSQLREQLAADVAEESQGPSNKRSKNTSTPGDTQRNKAEHKSPTNESKSGQSPGNESVHSIPSPSQFFAANKIISSMKAQLPDEYFNTDRQKDTFADIEKGICNQVPEYPSLKHPATPPQFSEASKLMSAIKSKLSYKASPRDNEKSFMSAKDRMEKLRANLSSEINESDLNVSNKSVVSGGDTTVEAMEVELNDDTNGVKQNIPVSKKDVIINGADVVLVVDTNIFIHELELIKNVLNSHIKGYSEQPTLLVPWRVINELDRLKDNNNGNGALCKRAKSAMDYLYKSLPENNRIVGQSLRDANSHIYPCEIPDDEILNCSLQQVERGKNVILLSNDKNLCNKATINNVRHISVSKLRDMLENREQGTDPELAATVKHYQQTMYPLLANILENEMRAKYNNLWQHVLFKPPPWTLSDVLQCLLKHWIAVFNEVFPRIEHILKDLNSSLTSILKKDQNTLTHSEVTNFKELCVDVARRCQIIPEYMELAKRTVDKLLHGVSDNAESEAPLVRAFEALWSVLSSYCSKLSSALGLPHSIEDSVPGNEPLPVLISKWSHFNTHLTELTLAIQGVLSVENPLEEHLQRLENAFNKALSSFCMDGPVTREQLRLFSSKCRNMLEEAHTKFTQLVELLIVCKNNYSQLN